MFTTTINGSYPSYPDPPRPRPLEIALADYQQGKIDDLQLKRARDRAVVEMVAEQITAGIEVVSDGNVRQGSTDEIVIRTGCNLHGIIPRDAKAGGHGSESTRLMRAIHQIKWAVPLLVDEYLFLSERSPVDVRPVLTGPLTLALNCELEHYHGDLSAAMHDLSQALHSELDDLGEVGARYVLLDEPELGRHKELAGVFFEACETLLRDLQVQVMLCVSGTDVIGFEDRLSQSAFAGVCFDLVEGPGNEVVLSESELWDGKIIQLDVLSGAAETMEQPMQIALELIKYSQFHDPDKIWVSGGSHLHQLNRELVRQKLVNMCQGANWARTEMARREEPGGSLR